MRTLSAPISRRAWRSLFIVLPLMASPPDWAVTPPAPASAAKGSGKGACGKGSGGKDAPPPDAWRRSRQRLNTEMDYAEGGYEDEDIEPVRRHDRGDGGWGNYYRSSEYRSDQNDVLQMLVRLVLTNAVALREIQSALFITVFLRSDSPVIRAMQAAGSTYANHTRGRRPAEHQMGGPVPYIVEAMIRALIDHDHGEALNARIRALHGSLGDLRMARETVRACRQRRCRDRDWSRIYFMFTERADQELVRDCFASMGASIADGMAPAGGLEYSLSQWIGRGRRS